MTRWLLTGAGALALGFGLSLWFAWGRMLLSWVVIGPLLLFRNSFPYWSIVNAPDFPAKARNFLLVFGTACLTAAWAIRFFLKKINP